MRKPFIKWMKIFRRIGSLIKQLLLKPINTVGVPATEYVRKKKIKVGLSIQCDMNLPCRYMDALLRPK